MVNQRCKIRYGGEVGHQSQAVPIPARSVNRREFWCCPNGRKHHSYWPILDTFYQFPPLNSPFGYNIGLNSTSDFADGAPNAKRHSNSTRYTASLSSGADHPVWFISFFLRHFSLHIIVTIC